MKKWFAIHTKPHTEFQVINYLNYSNIHTFMPKILVDRSHAKKKDKVLKPLFPSYLFAEIHINNNKSFRLINNTFGVKSILGFGKEPMEVTKIIIDDLKNITDKNGLMQRLDKPKYILGQDVSINEGPFLGIIGKFYGMKSEERVMMLLNLLGRNLKISLPTMHVSA